MLAAGRAYGVRGWGASVIKLNSGGRWSLNWQLLIGPVCPGDNLGIWWCHYSDETTSRPYTNARRAFAAEGSLPIADVNSRVRWQPVPW